VAGGLPGYVRQASLVSVGADGNACGWRKVEALMHLFEGLQSYEAVLLILGAVLFLAVVFLLIYVVMVKLWS
jgi:hypothetical protein